MEWTKLSLFNETSLQYSFHELSFSGIKILKVGFSGSWQHSDGRLIYVVSNAAVERWQPRGLVLDFQSLTYTWGDEMTMVFNAGCLRWVDDTPFPIVFIVSDLCREGMTTLVQSETDLLPAECIFNSDESAVLAIAKKIGE